MKRSLSLNLVGTTFSPGSTRLIHMALSCQSTALRAVRLVAEPDNPYDPNAIRVEMQGRKIGYVERKQAKTVVDLVRKGTVFGGFLVGNRVLEAEIIEKG